MSSLPLSRPLSRWPLAELPATSLSRARDRFFVDNDFGPDGGYDAPHQDAVLAGVPYRTPNGPARAEALRRHDLHHLLTGYATDWQGEAQISAWELGSGGAGLVWYAWLIALWGLFSGLLGDPMGMLRAFVRGRGSMNLYAVRVDAALLERRVVDVGASLGVRSALHGRAFWHASVPLWKRGLDAVAFAAWSVVSVAYVVSVLPILMGLITAGMVVALRARSVCCPVRLMAS